MSHSSRTDTSQPHRYQQVRPARTIQTGYASNTRHARTSSSELQVFAMQQPTPTWSANLQQSGIANAIGTSLFFDMAAPMAAQTESECSFSNGPLAAQPAASWSSDVPISPIAMAGASQQNIATKLGQKGQQTKVQLRCPYYFHPQKPCSFAKTWVRDIIRHMRTHRFYFCAKCSKQLDTKAEWNGHSCNQAFCVHFECQNRRGGPQSHGRKDGCPISFQDLEKRQKWYSLCALALPGLEPPPWEHICLAADGAEGMLSSSVEDPRSSTPRLSEVPELPNSETYNNTPPTLFQAEGRFQSQSHYIIDNVNGATGFGLSVLNPASMSTELNAQSRWQYHPQFDRPTQFSQPDQQRQGVVPWSRVESYGGPNVQMVNHNQPQASLVREPGAYAFDGRMNHASDNWCGSEQNYREFDDVQENFAFEYDDFTYDGDDRVHSTQPRLRRDKYPWL